MRGRARADKRREVRAPPRRADSPRGTHQPLCARRYRARRRGQDDKELHEGGRTLREHEIGRKKRLRMSATHKTASTNKLK